MDIKFIYQSPFGRFFILFLQKIGIFHLASYFLKTPLSKKMISAYIEKNGIDMSDFQGQEYTCFADFFARKRADIPCVATAETLISPCDGLLSVYAITKEMNIAMKGSHYRLIDLVPDESTVNRFFDGICLVFRLRASDYHHFCAFDYMRVYKTHFIPGQLQSVQPIACETLPVYRINRRWWSRLKCVHFGEAIQVEIGAMLVGGVHFTKERGWLKKGEEMGHFELAGSTILLMLSSDVRKHLQFYDKFEPAQNGKCEVEVCMGEEIGVLAK